MNYVAPTKKNYEYFQTSDISLSAALLGKGFDIRNITRREANKCVFVFDQDSDLEKTVSEFFNYNLKIDALTYFNALKDLKTRIYHT